MNKKERRKSLTLAGPINTIGSSILDSIPKSLPEEPISDINIDLPFTNTTQNRNDSSVSGK